MHVFKCQACGIEVVLIRRQELQPKYLFNAVNHKWSIFSVKTPRILQSQILYNSAVRE